MCQGLDLLSRSKCECIIVVVTHVLGFLAIFSSSSEWIYYIERVVLLSMRLEFKMLFYLKNFYTTNLNMYPCNTNKVFSWFILTQPIIESTSVDFKGMYEEWYESRMDMMNDNENRKEIRKIKKRRISRKGVQICDIQDNFPPKLQYPGCEWYNVISSRMGVVSEKGGEASGRIISLKCCITVTLFWCQHCSFAPPCISKTSCHATHANIDYLCRLC